MRTRVCGVVFGVCARVCVVWCLAARSQTPNIRYKPKVVINASADHFLACKTHLMMESRLHGRPVTQ